MGQEYFEPGRSPEDLGTDLTLSRELITEAYQENLDLALKAVKKLFSKTSDLGRVVVTADHGELLGERVWPLPVRQWGHPDGIYHPTLVRVPWHIYNDGDRRNVTPEAPLENESGDEDNQELTEHLQALGYSE